LGLIGRGCDYRNIGKRLELGIVVVLGQGWTDSDFEMVPFCRGFLRKLRALSGLLMGFFCGWYVLEVSFGE